MYIYKFYEKNADEDFYFDSLTLKNYILLVKQTFNN